MLTAIIIRATLSSSCGSLWSKSLKTVLRMAALRLLPAAPPVFPSKLCCTKLVHSASHTWQRWATSSDEVVSSSERSGATWASQNATASAFLESNFEDAVSFFVLRSPVIERSWQDCTGVGGVGFIFEESYGGSEMSLCEHQNSAGLIPSPPLSFSSFTLQAEKSSFSSFTLQAEKS